MSQGENLVILVGNLGRDPELRYTSSGTPVCGLSVATSRKYRDRKSDQLVEDVEWHRVSVFGNQAEHCNTYLRKGRQVYVKGRLRTRSFEDKDGVKRWSTEVIAERVQFLGTSAQGPGSASRNFDGDGGQGGWFGGEEPGDYDPAQHRKPDGSRR